MNDGAAARLDPILLEILDHALVAAAEEMSIAVWRTSRSTTVRELLDYSTAIFDRFGRNLAQAARMPVHLNSMEPCLQAIIEDFLPLEQWHDGDVIVTNDPYCGGQHLPDFLAFKPVFVAGQRMAIMGVLVHHVDVGGGAAGGYNAEATEIFQEGVRIPPVKIVSNGSLQRDVLNIVLQNVRDRETFRGDFISQISALEVGARSVRSLAGKYGADILAQAGRELMDHSEQAMRTAIAAIPDGVYRGEDWADGDGRDDRKRLQVELTVKGAELTIDLSGSSAQAAGPINCTLASTESAVYYAAIAAAGVTVSANSGCYRPITVIAPEGTVVNARFPAPVSMRVVIAHRVTTAVLRAFSEALPERIPASYYAASYNHAVLIEHEDGRREVYFDSEVGGWGGHPEEDGASGLAAGLHNLQNTPIEMLEALYPLHFLRYGLIPDSGGLGRRRGGLGIRREWRFEGHSGILNASFDAFASRPYGLAGGESGRGGRLIITRDGKPREMPPKVIGHRLRKGDIVTIETPGGGGHGPAAHRAKQVQDRDLADGYITKPLPDAPV